MLGWLWLGFGTLIAWIVLKCLDGHARALQEEERQAFAEQWPERCFDCSLARLMDREPRAHRCGDRDGALVPARGSEVAAVTVKEERDNG